MPNNKTDWSAIQRESAASLHQTELASKDKLIKAYLAKLDQTAKERDTALQISHRLTGVPTIKTSGTDAGAGESTAFAIASDWHVEETVLAKTVNGLNEFNLEIADRRITQFFQSIVRLTEIERHGTVIENLVLALLGDEISGFIHEELQESNGLSPTETILWLRTRIVAGIKMLLKSGGFKRIIVPCCYGNHGRCHDAETELLTKAGWKKYDELSVGELVATYRMKDGANEWQPLTDVYRAHYKGEMIHVKHSSADFMVTPRHRMVVTHRHDGEASIVEMQDITQKTCHRGYFPKSTTGTSVDYAGVTDDELSLLGWVMTDGSYTKHRKTGLPIQVIIGQCKPSGVATIRDLLNRLGYSYLERTRDRTGDMVICGTPRRSNYIEHNFNVSSESSKRVIELLPKKLSIPQWMFGLSSRQVKVLLESLMLGDGTGKVVDGVREYSILGGRKEFIDQVQALLLVNGISCRLHKNIRGEHSLSIRASNNTSINAGSFDKNVRRVDYDGIIWCGTVDNGTLITRRNGIPLVSGNTTKKMRHATGAVNSYEWMMYHVLASDLPEVEWHIADGYHQYVEVYGRLFRFHHGDNVMYNGGIGGLTIPMEKAIAAWNKGRVAPYMDIFGHHHTAMQNPRFISNGSLIGYGAYSLAIKAGFEPPQQTYFLLDSKRGRTGTWPIFLN